jgi:hypothetical protein
MHEYLLFTKGLQLLYLKLTHRLQIPDVADDAAEDPANFVLRCCNSNWSTLW